MSERERANERSVDICERAAHFLFKAGSCRSLDLAKQAGCEARIMHAASGNYVPNYHLVRLVIVPNLVAQAPTPVTLARDSQQMQSQ